MCRADLTRTLPAMRAALYERRTPERSSRFFPTAAFAQNDTWGSSLCCVILSAAKDLARQRVLLQHGRGLMQGFHLAQPSLAHKRHCVLDTICSGRDARACR